jgi:peptidoglycan/LPS O-acetylase OafA/YrhL
MVTASVAASASSASAIDHLGYRAPLDGLRAVAVLAVVGYHTGWAVFGGGNSGVWIFFVLSGFLITKLLLEEGRLSGAISLARFWVRRALRLGPPLLAVLAVVGLLAMIASDHLRASVWVEIGLAVGYVTNVAPLFTGVDGYGERYLEHTWSLALEEQFYVVWPLFVVGLRLFAARSTRVVAVVLAVGAASAVARGMVTASGNLDLATLPIFNLDPFCLGIALAFAVSGAFPPELVAFLRRRWVGVAALALLLVDVSVGGGVPSDLAFLRDPYVGVLSAVLIGHLLFAPAAEPTAARLLSRPRAVYLGKVSYSLYLWHFPAFAMITRERFPGLPFWLVGVLKVAVAFGLAVASYHLLERPIAAVRARWRTAGPRRADREAPVRISAVRPRSVSPAPVPSAS